MAWYYQTTPRDSWDYDSVQKLILADLHNRRCGPIRHHAGLEERLLLRPRPQDRQAALRQELHLRELGIACRHEDRAARCDGRRPTGMPRPRTSIRRGPGGHTWNPMSYSAQTHLVYIPVIDVSAVWVDMLHNGGTMKYLDGFFTVQGIFPDDTYDAAALKKSVWPGARPAVDQGDAKGEAGAGTAARLGSGGAKDRVGARDLRREFAATTAASCRPRAIWCSRDAAAASCGSMRPTPARC